MLAVQLLLFLKMGSWPHWAMADLIPLMSSNPFLRWLDSPQDWVGLQKVLRAILDFPLSALMFLLAILMTNIGKPE